MKSGPNCTKCGLHFCNHDLIGCLKYTLNQPKSMVTNRKHKKHFVPFNSIPYESHLPQLTPQWGVIMVSIRHKERTQFFGCVKNFLVFGHFTQKALQNLGKTYLGHVPINRSHQMNNHFFATKGHYM